MPLLTICIKPAWQSRRRLGPPNGNSAHEIITDHPDGMWATDATRLYTMQDGWCWFFGAVEQAQQIIGELITRYNTQWLIERLGYRTPAQVRAEAQRPERHKYVHTLSRKPGAIQNGSPFFM